ncbi:MAG TPA: carboxypeptidase-like regulatory domain-containing protein [Candidatus Acidoferrum sp.]|nr:carboxypeptidase-like regulatory domain-containing protein [Candidatus Acidoferrum sp.]
MNVAGQWRETGLCAGNAETQSTRQGGQAQAKVGKHGKHGGACNTSRILRGLKQFSAFSAVMFRVFCAYPTHRRLRLGRFVFASLLPCLLPLVALAGTITGTVRNGTTNEPASGVQITLIRLQGVMQEAATTKTDAQGRYSISDPTLGQAPMLLRATYKGVNYFQPAVPGKTTADMQVYEHTEKPSAFSVADRAIILQPTSSGLTVGEIYDIQNNTQPPQAYYRENGSFEFSVPRGAQVGDVSASDSSQMPVRQATIDKGPNLEAIDFPFRPGESGVRISYTLPYTNDHADLQFTSPYAAERVAIFAPPTVKVTGDGFSPAGQNQGFDAYIRSSVGANTPVSLSISGTGTVTESDSSAAGDQGQGDANANSRTDQGGQADSSGQSASITTLPARLDSLQWVLVAGFAAIFALGFVFLWKRPQFLTGASAGYAQGGSVDVSAAAGVQGVTANGALKSGLATGTRDVDAFRNAQHMPAQPPSAAESLAVEEAQRHVSGSLDDLKDKLFRLELRKQAGTISEEDYGRERQRIEELLRSLVRG